MKLPLQERRKIRWAKIRLWFYLNFYAQWVGSEYGVTCYDSDDNVCGVMTVTGDILEREIKPKVVFYSSDRKIDYFLF